MDKYVKVYAFCIIQEIADGKVVYMLDRDAGEVYCVNNLPIWKVLDILRTDDEAGRFDFWRIEKGEGENVEV